MKPRHFLALVAILALGLGLRVHGITAGLPGTAFGDEQPVVHHAVGFGSGDLNPHFFVYPSLFMYLTAVVYGGYFLVGRALGTFPSLTAFKVQFFVDESPFFLLARLEVVAFALLTLIVLFNLARSAYGTASALLATLLLAISPVHVLDSHVATTDVPMTFFVVAAWYSLDRLTTSDRWGDLVLASTAIGLGAATKYIPIVLLGSLLVARWSVAARVSGRLALLHALLLDRKLWAGAAISVAVFAIASPYNLLDFSNAWSDIRVYILQSQSPAEQNRAVLARMLRDHGVPWLIVMGIGAAVLLRQHRPRDLVGVTFGALFVALMVARGYYAARYFSYLAPMMAVLAAIGLAWLGGRWAAGPRRWVAAACLALVLVFPLVATAATLTRLSNSSTRQLAREWIHANLPADTAIVVDPYLRLAPTEEAVRGKLALLEGVDGERARLVRTALSALSEARWKEPRYRLIFSRNYPLAYSFGVVATEDYYDVGGYVERGAEYFVIAMPRYGEMSAPQYRAFFGVLERVAVLVHRVPAEPERRLGPEIRIYRIGRGVS
ncbi:MAG: hypothetical protein A3I00_05480 [Betaproteobacteria bacterium RIFCSPLOWO2_02_FULL_64_12]|nr:MAG: hypothetical protein A3I00_05480 [Betaproteobacteria bacterium RIFCSPLOWO2_02_FULL_64_12]